MKHKTQRRPKIVRTADYNCAYVSIMALLIIYPVILQTSDFQPGFRGTQGFHERLPRVPQLASKSNSACEITPDNVIKIHSIDVFFV